MSKITVEVGNLSQILKDRGYKVSATQLLQQIARDLDLDHPCRGRSTQREMVERYVEYLLGPAGTVGLPEPAGNVSEIGGRGDE